MKSRLSKNRLLAAALAVTSVAGSALGVAGIPATAAPAPGKVIFSEDFENNPAPEPIRLTDYQGAGGQKYGADQEWLSDCNGWVNSFSQPDAPAAPLADCQGQSIGQWAFNRVQQMSWALGSHAGGDPVRNHAVSAQTEDDPGAGHIEFQTLSNIPFSGSNRYVTFSVDVAAANCENPGTKPPLLQFTRVDESGNSTALGGAIDGCSNPKTVDVPAKGQALATKVHVGTYAAPGATLVNGGSIGIRMVNNEGTFNGNDHAFDNIKMLDVTPTASKAFSPSTITPGQTSKLTVTIENTTELASKDNFSFTDKLPAGVTIASDPAASTTCGDGTVTAAAGSSSLSLAGGDLAQGAASCTVTVNVTAVNPGKYTNDPADFEQVGLNKPGPADLEVIPSVDLVVTKVADPSLVHWPVNPDGTVAYKLIVTNNGPNDSTGWTVTDPLPDQLQNPTTSTAGCTINGSDLVCNGGPLRAGSTFTITVKGTAPKPPATLVMNNCVEVKGRESDPDPASNRACQTVVVEPIPIIDPAVGTAAAAAVGLGGFFFLRRRNAVRGQMI
ncbi:putative repeat protein (TIGR01451 family) [Streptomyces sp. V4I8]|uniref:DUF7933 domain-containing protein n=1 Tax=Streptomyces sp. V4I8 TaxID=3156469 RepID=UPI0035122FF2